MRVGGSIKTKLVAGPAAAVIISLSILPAHANALSLGDATLNLPLGKLGEPVAELLNPVTEILPVPVTVNSSPTDVGADITLPSLGDTPKEEAPNLSLNARLPESLSTLTEPLSQLTNPVLEPVKEIVAPITQPLTNTLGPITRPNLDNWNLRPAATNRQASVTPPPVVSSLNQPTGTLTVQQKDSPDSIAVVAGPADSQPPSESPTLFAGITGFFSSTLPSALSGLMGKNISILPILISALILLATMVAVGTILYTNYFGGRVVIGRYNLTKYAQMHDITQLAAFAVAVSGFGIITILLSFTLL